MSNRVFIDFGIRKPHAVLSGRGGRVRFVDDFQRLHLVNCQIYLEEGCPGHLLQSLLGQNEVFLVDGRAVKAARDSIGLSKTDSNDVLALRELVRQQPLLPRRLTQQEIEEVETRQKYSYYCKIASLIASLKNRQRSLSVEFGESLPHLDAILVELEREKRKAARCFMQFAPVARRLQIRGVGPRYLGGILVKAHPDRFRSLSSYLYYCGLKGSAIESKRYSRHVRSLYHQLAASVVMQKDVRFYRLYRKVKRDLAERFPDAGKSRIEGKAKNRLATFLAKEIYARLRSPV
jgi:hypothetical protein